MTMKKIPILLGLILSLGNAGVARADHYEGEGAPAFSLGVAVDGFAFNVSQGAVTPVVIAPVVRERCVVRSYPTRVVYREPVYVYPHGWGHRHGRRRHARCGW
jgi:hypothetical protein